MVLAAIIAFLARLSLVLLFLPFSALDKLLNFDAAVGQAHQAMPSKSVDKALIFVGLFVEIVMSLGVLTGIADRLCGFVLAGYCAVTALLWKQFWTKPDFRLRGESQGREVFWDFLKNFAVAGGFLAVAFGSGPTTAGVKSFITNWPLAASHPYSDPRPYEAP